MADPAKQIHQIHLGLAEAGKVLALKGKHQDALRHYREAIKTAVSANSPEVFFRHYTHCVLESLELSGAYEEVIAFCENADEHYKNLTVDTPMVRRDHANTLERWGVALLKNGQAARAEDVLARAVEKAAPAPLPVATQILSWLERRFNPDVNRIAQIQKQHAYFTVRREQVDPKKATYLPKNHHHAAPAAFAAQH